MTIFRVLYHHQVVLLFPDGMYSKTRIFECEPSENLPVIGGRRVRTTGGLICGAQKTFPDFYYTSITKRTPGVKRRKLPQLDVLPLAGTKQKARRG
jgi:hypothetical protein